MFFATFCFSISSFKLIKQLNIVSFTSLFTSELKSTIFKFSFYSIIMMKTLIICSFSFSSISFRTSILSHQKKHITSKIYMMINDLFVMFAKKQFKKNLNIIQKRINFSMFRQIQIDQLNFISINSFKSNVFINCFNSTFRICFSINRTTNISQYCHIAIDTISNIMIQSKIEFYVFVKQFKQKNIVIINNNNINKNNRVETSLT